MVRLLRMGVMMMTHPRITPIACTQLIASSIAPVHYNSPHTCTSYYGGHHDESCLLCMLRRPGSCCPQAFLLRELKAGWAADDVAQVGAPAWIAILDNVLEAR